MKNMSSISVVQNSSFTERAMKSKLLCAVLLIARRRTKILIPCETVLEAPSFSRSHLLSSRPNRLCLFHPRYLTASNDTSIWRASSAPGPKSSRKRKWLFRRLPSPRSESTASKPSSMSRSAAANRRPTANYAQPRSFDAIPI